MSFSGHSSAVLQLSPAARRERAAQRLQAGFRLLLARRAELAARRLLVSEELLWRLATVVARAEARAAALIQWRWRVVRNSRDFHGRLAVKRIQSAIVSHQAHRIAKELKARVEREQAELRAAVRVQAALRRCIARRHAARAARTRAVGLLRAQFCANREERAIGRVQRAWVASVARRREREARGQAEAADLLTLRLARARAAELRTRHFAALVARHMRLYVQSRIRVAGELRGWLSKRVQPGSWSAPTHPWRRRFFWVADGALLYDSVKWRTARSRGIPIRELSETHRIGPNDFRLRFGRAGSSRTLTLRSSDPAAAEDWRRKLAWLARISDAPLRSPLSPVQYPQQRSTTSSAPHGGVGSRSFHPPSGGVKALTPTQGAPRQTANILPEGRRPSPSPSHTAGERHAAAADASDHKRWHAGIAAVGAPRPDSAPVGAFAAPRAHPQNRSAGVGPKATARLPAARLPAARGGPPPPPPLPGPGTARRSSHPGSPAGGAGTRPLQAQPPPGPPRAAAAGSPNAGRW